MRLLPVTEFRAVSLGLLVAALLGIVGPVFGQQASSGSVYGTVGDPQELPVPGAEVTIIQTGTNLRWSTVTDQTGHYQFPTLPVGEYRLSVVLPGFKRNEVTGLVLQVNQHKRLDARLEVGEVTESVFVSAEAPLVETTASPLTSVVDRRRIVELPLQGRNVAELTLLSAGATPASGVSGGGGDGAMTNRASLFVSVGGSRNTNVRYQLDGGTNTDVLLNTGMPFPFPDAVQEFSVVTSGQSADTGRASGATVNIVTRSGSNQFHGNVFWFVRNPVFNARNFFATYPDELRRNQAGFTFGGPVIRDRLFFFAGYQATISRRRLGDGRVRTMPAAYREGDFSSLLKRPTPIIIRDPWTGEAFPNNIIPKERLSPAMTKLMSFWPRPGPDGFFYFGQREVEDTHSPVYRIDFRLSDRHDFHFRHLYDRNERTFPGEGTVIPTYSGTGGRTYSHSLTAGHVWTVTRNLLATTNYSIAKAPGTRLGSGEQGLNINIETLGVKVNRQPPPWGLQEGDEIDVGSLPSGIAMATTARTGDFNRISWEIAHHWRYQRGRHSLSWGFEFARSSFDEWLQYLTSGRWRFDGRWSGFDAADAMLGAAYEFWQSTGEVESRRHRYQGFFVGDAYRIHDRLSLNLGLRWEPFLPMTENQGRTTLFHRAAYDAGIRSTLFPLAPPGVFYPGDPHPDGGTVPDSGAKGSLANLAPRIGLAWNVFGDNRTSLRVSYGIYYDNPQLVMLYGTGFTQPHAPTVGVLGQLTLFDDPYRGREKWNIFPVADPRPDPNLVWSLPSWTYAVQSNWPMPYTQNWNLSIERQFGREWMGRVAYVGSKGTHLISSIDASAAPYDHSLSFSENRRTHIQRLATPKLYPLYLMVNGDNSSYHSFQATLDKRMARHYSIAASYTFSKLIDVRSSNHSNHGNAHWNPWDTHYFRALADFHRAHRAVTSFIWRPYEPSWMTRSPILSAILNNWSMSGIVTLQSGTPFNSLSSSDPMATGRLVQSPADVVGPLGITGGRSRSEQVAQYFNPNAVRNAAPGTFGTLGRNAMIGPGYAAVDLSLVRHFPLKWRDTTRFSFRAEFFNFFNRPNFGNPAGTPERSDTGQIRSAADPRIMQFGLKLDF